MVKETPVLTEISGNSAVIWLNRPEKHNALNIEMLSQFLQAILHLNNVPSIRIITIRGKGNSFCSGADLNWMQNSLSLSIEENYVECEILASCFHEIYNSKKIIISQVHGFCMGGGNGFAAASDIVLAENNSVFAFSEVLLGLVPATIMPYVTAKTGPGKISEYLLTGRNFTAGEAKETGLVNRIYDEPGAQEILEGLISQLLRGAPEAQRTIKYNLRNPYPDLLLPGLKTQTANQLAGIRTSLEAREGVNACLQKRLPVWENEML
ncbi:MAG TPA: enoyl-CoA hydratase-related protein [Bacteroidales bacterium]|nr:enoyl-CoA hydratase-related protein [Bacteroidales bacterium]